MKTSLTEEHKRKIGESLKGRAAWNKGMKMSDEMKRRISISLTGRKHSDETKMKMSETRKGKTPTEETRMKLSKANKGKKRTQEFRDRISGKNSPHWRGGFRKHCGYVQIMSPEHPFRTSRNYVLEHRLVIEKQINRFLNQEEHVHHINRNKKDNRTVNLMAFVTNSAHIRFEKGGHVNPSEIIFDGRIFHLNCS